MKVTEKNKEIELDTSGTECPIPVLKARKLAQDISDGTIVKVISTDPLAKAMDNEKALYASLGTQIGAATNFVSVGSSASGCLGNEYYRRHDARCAR